MKFSSLSLSITVFLSMRISLLSSRQGEVNKVSVCALLLIYTIYSPRPSKGKMLTSSGLKIL